jgi:hypothetical protein
MVAMVAGLGLLTGGPAWAEDTARPASDPLADAKLELKIEGVITRDERLAQQPVIVEVSKGALTLSGTVATPADRTRVEQVARAAGAERIDNRLTVVTETDQAREATRQPLPRNETETPAKTGESAKPAPEARGDREALSDPRRRDPLVETMPAEQTGSREVRLRTLGMPDPALEKREAEKNQKTAPAQPAKATEPR